MSKDSFVLLHGAKKNVGDFLIYERARQLIEHYRQPAELLELPRWLPLDEHLGKINRSTAVIMCGGPGYASSFYPGIFPFVKSLLDIRVPIVPFGLGWSGKPNDTSGNFAFTKESRDAIKEIHSRIPYSSVRDILTEKIIKELEIQNVVTTGCPAWYSLPDLERDFQAPQQIKQIVVSTPAQIRNFYQAKQVVDLVRKRFPKAQKHLVFHRGILPDRNKTIKKSLFDTGLAAYGKTHGFHILDASYSVRKIDFYRDCDLHIGFRVHAHLDFLSFRKPSILIQEDGRGLGQSITLQTEDISTQNPNFLQELEIILNNHLQDQFIAFEKTISLMKEKHEVMKQFLMSF